MVYEPNANSQNPNTGQSLAGGASQTIATFTCPTGGRVRCTLVMRGELGSHYGLNVF